MANQLLKDTIISVDIETTGLAAGIHSMIALGAVAYRDGKEVSSFYASLKEWEGSTRSEDTMKFWGRNQTEWNKIQKEARDPQTVMEEFYNWVGSLPAPRVVAGNPAVFDCTFLYWYLSVFVGEEAVNKLFDRIRALDIRTYIAAFMGVPYSEAERKLIPNEWKENLPYTHNALDDARQQGVVLMNMLRANSGEEVAATA